MALKDYHNKRKFDETSEPKGKTKKSKDKLIFVIQRHAASRLHYDFRLEMEGVLKSWAVPKGPSLDPKDKRLAMMVEDHPYDYKDFEGNIPEGNYGAGQVEVWDSGTYEPLDENSRLSDEKELLKELHAGSLKFILHGKKLKGEFALVKMKNSEDNAWLLIKHKDEFVESPYDAEENTSPKSLVTQFLEEKKSLKKSGKKKS
ncbi:3'-phosphoesterase [Chryseobacterium arthrosphaerae]|uniref:DNA polymerase ligase N-terminal domain-containing protein n=1 Tax=Chryseobacterium arthrosphaerae TaxID=651561 RepID=UPI000F4D8621|nr:DNA polymerase ligase N-terminal domain-containing protein [Chryseobacterium arthrosphaerae]AYZ13934.1 3'-phosphoesterase [Chryseobacterium arthrosphaerae]